MSILKSNGSKITGKRKYTYALIVGGAMVLIVTILNAAGVEIQDNLIKIFQTIFLGYLGLNVGAKLVSPLKSILTKKKIIQSDKSLLNIIIDCVMEKKPNLGVKHDDKKLEFGDMGGASLVLFRENGKFKIGSKFSDDADEIVKFIIAKF